MNCKHLLKNYEKICGKLSMLMKKVLRLKKGKR